MRSDLLRKIIGFSISYSTLKRDSAVDVYANMRDCFFLAWLCLAGNRDLLHMIPSKKSGADLLDL